MFKYFTFVDNMNGFVLITFVTMATLVCLGSSSPLNYRGSIRNNFNRNKYTMCFKKYNLFGCVNKKVLGKNDYDEIKPMEFAAVVAQCKDEVRKAKEDCKSKFGQNV